METNTDTTTSKPAARRIVKEKTALKSLCSQLRIEPKAARRTLRKAGLSFHGMRERWIFTPKQLEQAREILKPSKPAKAAKKSKPAPAADAPATN